MEEPDLTIKLESHIQKGLDLLREENYAEAIEFFSNYLEEFGLEYGQPKECWLSKTPTSEETKGIIDTIAHESKFDNQSVEGKKILFLASAHINPFLSNTAPQVVIPEIILKNTALVHAEVWLHAYQVAKRQPLTGVENKEIDVAIYLSEQGVPLTEEFLNRYGRKTALLKRNFSFDEITTE